MACETRGWVGLPVRFLRFFSKSKIMTFYVFLSCLTRFLEHWTARSTYYTCIGYWPQRCAAACGSTSLTKTRSSSSSSSPSSASAVKPTLSAPLLTSISWRRRFAQTSTACRFCRITSRQTSTLADGLKMRKKLIRICVTQCLSRISYCTVSNINVKELQVYTGVYYALEA